MDLKNWQEKISQKVEQRTYRDFLINIVSLFPLNLYKFKNLITIYPPKTSQNLNLKDTLELIDSKVLEKDYDFDQDFFSNWQNLFQNTLLPNIIDFGSNENSRFANLIY